MSAILTNRLEDKLKHISDPYTHKVTNDFDEQASFLSGWNQDYTQVSAGSLTDSLQKYI
jgi:uncharacterized membrane-anchored protein YhcB (DUF1043 family)